MAQPPIEHSFEDVYGAAPKLFEIREKVLFGDIWERKELSKRERSLVTVAILATQRAQDEVRTHIGRAIRNGATKDEVAEVIVQVALYAGWPAGVNASMRAREAYQHEVAE